jgi:hypothetical protein
MRGYLLTIKKEKIKEDKTKIPEPKFLAIITGGI